MIIGDRKKATTSILARLGKGGEQTTETPDAGGDVLALAEDLLQAIESKSAQAVADAFRALAIACDDEPGEESEGPG